MEPTPSDQDIKDAEDLLFAHPPRQVAYWVCGCGEEYPCTEVRWAWIVKQFDQDRWSLS